MKETIKESGEFGLTGKVRRFPFSVKKASANSVSEQRECYVKNIRQK